MNRFLRNQLEDTEIPEQAYLQARNRAWERIQAGTPAARLALPWAAAAVFATIALFVIWWGSETPRTGPGPSPSRATSRAPEPMLQSKQQSEIPPPQNRGPQANSAAVKLSLKGAAAKGRERATAKTPERIVLNFVLPETGVRMIWISDSKFKLEGANE